MIRLMLFCTLSTLLLFATEQEYNRGEMLYLSKGCNACHGPLAEGGGKAPKLAQQREIDLSKKLIFFRKGNAKSQSQAMMVQFALKLSDQDISDLSYFLSHHKKDESENLSSELLGGFGS